jgi:transposase InsO family protein
MELDSDTDATHPDIWTDGPVMHFLRYATMPDQATAKERRRIAKRAKNYSYNATTCQLTITTPSLHNLIVPKPAERQVLIMQAHDDLGHFSAVRTTEMLRATYYWHAMGTTIANYCRTCARCQLNNPKLFTAPSEMRSTPMHHPFHTVCVDLAGPLVESKAGNQYIIFIIDTYTKWAEAVPIPNKRSSTTALALNTALLSRHGNPIEVVTDQGKEFRKHFDRILQQRNIHHRSTAAYNPQANGQVERFVRTVKAALTKMCDTDNTMWDHYLPDIMAGYRFSSQASTKTSPFNMLYGRTPNIFRTTPTPALDSPLPDDLTADQLMDELTQRAAQLSAVHKQAETHAERAQGHQRSAFRKRHLQGNTLPPPPIGAVVLRQLHNVRKQDLADSRTGPYKVTGYQGDNQTIALLKDGNGAIFPVATKDLTLFDCPLAPQFPATPPAAAPLYEDPGPSYQHIANWQGAIETPLP